MKKEIFDGLTFYIDDTITSEAGLIKDLIKDLGGKIIDVKPIANYIVTMNKKQNVINKDK